MGEKDIAEKTLEAYNDVFADIVNVLLFKGERLVEEDALTDMTPTSQYKADGKLHAQERDVAKYWQKIGVRIAIFGLENQTNIDLDMPLRVIGYDGAAYRAQLNAKNQDETGYIHRYPVVTLVLYFGKRPWKKSRTLYDRLSIPEKLKPYVSDYRINVFEICRLSPEQVNLFKSDFKVVADYFVQTFRNKSYVPSTDTLKHVHEVMELLAVLTQNSQIEDLFNAYNSQQKGQVKTMKGIFDQVLEQGYNKGISIGEARGISIGEARGISIGRQEERKDLLTQLIANGEITATQAAKYQRVQ